MEKKNLLVTPLKQIALNGNRREVLPGLSRTWAGEIMPADATTLPSPAFSGGLLCVLLCTAQEGLLASAVLFVMQELCFRHCWGFCLAA